MPGQARLLDQARQGATPARHGQPSPLIMIDMAGMADLAGLTGVGGHIDAGRTIKHNFQPSSKAC